MGWPIGWRLKAIGNGQVPHVQQWHLEFYQRTNMRKIGIDTGKHGGIVLANNDIIGWVMPLDVDGEIDLHALDVIFKGIRPTVYGDAIVTIEDPGKHAKSSQAIGGMRYGFGL